MNDNILKNLIKRLIKGLNGRKYRRYVAHIRNRSEEIPDFSLMTSDCMGGLIYHTMGRRFLSPTINMSIKDSDFLKLILDRQYYFLQKIQFVPYDKYPVGYIGEGSRRIEIRFEHYSKPEEAETKWEERKKRCLERCFIIMADQDLSDREIEQFKSVSAVRKILFTWNKERADGKEIIYIRPYGKPIIKNYSKLNLDGFRDYEHFFDYIAWLKMEDSFMLE